MKDAWVCGTPRSQRRTSTWRRRFSVRGLGFGLRVCVCMEMYIYIYIYIYMRVCVCVCGGLTKLNDYRGAGISDIFACMMPAERQNSHTRGPSDHRHLTEIS